MGSFFTAINVWLMYILKVYFKVDLDRHILKFNNWRYNSKLGWVVIGTSGILLYCAFYHFMKGD